VFDSSKSPTAGLGSLDPAPRRRPAHHTTLADASKAAFGRAPAPGNPGAGWNSRAGYGLIDADVTFPADGTRSDLPEGDDEMNRLALALTVASVAAMAGFGAFAQTSQEKKEKTLTFEVYKDTKGEFRWRLKATNGEVIATSGEGYKAKADCTHAIDLIKEGASKATTVEK
jgi:uncharacterized protein